MREERFNRMQYDSLINKTLLDMKPSGIRRFFDLAHEMEDVISLSVGEPEAATNIRYIFGKLYLQVLLNTLDYQDKSLS